MTLKNTVPLIQAALVAHLDAQFPDRCARPSMSEREVWMEAGARQVVDHLKAAHERQQKGDKLPKVL